LLDKDLGELDHGWIAVERMGEIDHVVGGILLIARPRGSKKGAKRSDCNWVALFTAPSGILKKRTRNSQALSLVRKSTRQKKRTHAASHFVVDADMT
jgi:hypothetical protein